MIETDTLHQMSVEIWRPQDTTKPSPDTLGSEIYRPDIQDAIEKSIHELDEELRSLSLDIHSKFEFVLKNCRRSGSLFVIKAILNLVSPKIEY